tara:strand:- start:10442 stop:10618 length:177 start_codon:yes stop_codon:yes gene_type:complete
MKLNRGLMTMRKKGLMEFVLTAVFRWKKELTKIKKFGGVDYAIMKQTAASEFVANEAI